MTLRILTISFFLCLGFQSCYYDNEEELYGTTECTTENVTYSGTVLKILQDNCYRCHDAANNNGNITLEGYDKLKIVVESGDFLGAIKRDPGFSPMPKNEPPLLECDIEKIETWVTAGALNN